MSKNSVEMIIEISPFLNNKLDEMSKATHLTKSELLKRAIFLMDAAVETEKKGNHLAILDKHEHKIGNVRL